MNHYQRALKYLKQHKKFNPKCILDIGAYHGDWTKMISTVFPEANIIMFDANRTNNDILEKLTNDKIKYHNACLSDIEKIVEFYSKSIDSDNSGASYYKEIFGNYRNDVITTKIQTQTLDTFVSEHNDIDFIKLDTQGSELDILEGAKNTLKNNNVKYILLELIVFDMNCNSPTFEDRIIYMKKIGYRLIDIWEICYLKRDKSSYTIVNNETGDILFQIDILFERNFDGVTL